jgi:hypothetical protein
VTQTYTRAVIRPNLARLFIFYVLYELSQGAVTSLCLQKSYNLSFPVIL